MGNNFFLKQIFLRGNFGDQVLEERFLRGGTFASKYFGGIFVRKISL